MSLPNEAVEKNSPLFTMVHGEVHGPVNVFFKIV
jgi:hypothetical protein